MNMFTRCEESHNLRNIKIAEYGSGIKIWAIVRHVRYSNKPSKIERDNKNLSLRCCAKSLYLHRRKRAW